MRDTRFWFLNIVCGLIILVVLGVHMGIMHLDGIMHAVFGVGADPLQWQSMLKRGASVLFTGTYVLALGAALFHGLYGMRTMLVEYFDGPRAARWITATCWLLGLGLFALGGTATLLFHAGTAGVQ